MVFSFKTIDDISLSSGAALCLVDFNVPIIGGKITDDTRITAVLPTIKTLRQKGLRIVLISHFGKDGSASLAPVAKYLRNFFPVVLANTLEEAREKLADNEVVLLENIRRFSGEAENDSKFAEHLSTLGDIYVNEGFSVSHRPHASVVGLPRYLKSYAGLLFKREVETLAKAFNPAQPFVFILGGKKTETKIPLIEKFLPIAEKLFVGGAVANAFWKAAGQDIGDSFVSGEELVKPEWLQNPKIVLPREAVIRRGERQLLVPLSVIQSRDKIVDAGTSFTENLKIALSQAKFVIWNGSFGITEEGFKETEAIGRAVAECGAETIVGGGDTVGVLKDAGLIDKFSFVSTGGGAMLEFLAIGTLPGVKALELRCK